jgi:hypothetical protein
MIWKLVKNVAGLIVLAYLTTLLLIFLSGL